jgi:hypothetical protein
VGGALDCRPFGIRKVDQEHAQAKTRPLSQQRVLHVVEIAEAALNQLLAQADVLSLGEVSAEHGDNKRTHGPVFANIADAMDAYAQLVPHL